MNEKCWLSYSCKLKDPTECNPEDCIRLFKLGYLYEQSLLGKEYLGPLRLESDSSNLDYEAFINLGLLEHDIVRFVQQGGNLYLHSIHCGNGKTTWAAKLLKAYLDNIWPESGFRCRALFINVPRFLLALKDSISNQNTYIDHIKANILDADLVVWDEIATKSLTTYEHEHLLSLINTRLDEGKSNIYTSNLVASELVDKLGERLYSRIAHNSIDIEFNEFDKRGLK